MIINDEYIDENQVTKCWYAEDSFYILGIKSKCWVIKYRIKNDSNTYYVNANKEQYNLFLNACNKKNEETLLDENNQ
jgi:hypothetical protein